jgi:hypothetical protein
MGWYYTHGASRADTIRELTPAERRDDNGRIFRTLRHCCRGNVLFTLQENITPEGVSTKWIGVSLMQRSAEGWGYKPMDESMHPYYYNCPLSYLDEASEPVNESSANWRAQVRFHAAAKAEQDAKSPQVGEIWSCTGKNCKRIRIAALKGRRIEAYNLSPGGGYYRIPKKMLGERMAEGGN